MRCSLTSLGRRWRKGWIEWYLLYSGEQLLCAPECANAQRCLSSPFDAIREEFVAATEGCTLVVSTNNVGDVCYIVFTSSIDVGKSPVSKWRQIFLQLSFSRVTKLTPALFFALICRPRHLRGRKVASGSKSPQFGQPTGRRRKR